MRLMTVHWLAVLSLVVMSVGCESAPPGGTDSGADNPPVPPKASDIGLLIEPLPAADMGYRIGWASPVQLLRGQEIAYVSALDDIIIVIEQPRNVVTAMRADNGELLWKIILGSDLEQLYGPSRDGEQLFIHSDSRFFTVSTRDGSVTAVAKLETTVGSSAVYSPQTRLAVMSGVNGRVFAHSVDNNFSRWRYELSNRILSSPVLVGRDVFVIDRGGTYAMVQANNGKPLWRNRALGGVTTSPGFQGSEIIVASEDGKLYAINRTTGKDTWVYLGAEQPLAASPLVLGRLIVQPLSPNDGLVGIDAINGKELWRSDLNATPIMARQQDLLLHTPNTLVSINLDDGTVLTEGKTLKLQTVIPVGNDGAVILVGPTGRLLRLSPL